MVRHDLALLLDTSSAWVAPLVQTIRCVGSLCQIGLMWLSSICILFLLGVGALLRSFPLTLVSCAIILLFSHGVFRWMIFGRFWIIHAVTNLATRCWLSCYVRLFQRDLPLVYASNLVFCRHLLLLGIVEAISLDLLCLDLQFLVVLSSISYLLLLLLLLPSLYILALLVLSVAIVLLSLAVLLAHVGHVIWLETQRVIAVHHTVWLI